MRSITTSRLLKTLSCFALALLALTQFSHAQAGPGPVSSATATVLPPPTATPVVIYGLVNPGFGTSGGCHTKSWIGGGVFSAVSDAPNADCYATVGGRYTIPNSTPVTSTSYLEQTFVVDPSAPVVSFYLQTTKSANQDPNYPAQTVSIYSSAGAVIYQKSRNHNGSECFRFNYDLSNYAGQSVRLRVSTMNPGTDPNSVTMNIDDHLSWYCPGPQPEGSPGPGAW